MREITLTDAHFCEALGCNALAPNGQYCRRCREEIDGLAAQTRRDEAKSALRAARWSRIAYRLYGRFNPADLAMRILAAAWFVTCGVYVICRLCGAAK